jgi:hypothetical protein
MSAGLLMRTCYEEALLERQSKMVILQRAYLLQAGA